jgi:hypothetical protein
MYGMEYEHDEHCPMAKALVPVTPLLSHILT